MENGVTLRAVPFHAKLDHVVIHRQARSFKVMSTFISPGAERLAARLRELGFEPD
jgi:hypothetical protein